VTNLINVVYCYWHRNSKQTAVHICDSVLCFQISRAESSWTEKTFIQKMVAETRIWHYWKRSMCRCNNL